jgi:dipeptidase
MRSDVGILDYYELNRIMAERARTAREAIQIADEITKKYGYIDGGECFTIADPHEVWHLEIIGPGKGKKGAVWVAQRVPDDHISVNANGSRIREIDLSKPDYFMASDNYKSRAIELGLYDPESGKPFEFCYVYADRKSMATRRREWRVFDLLAPYLKLDPNGENFPFSIKPEKKVSPRDIMTIFRDTFEGTPFDMTKYMLVPETDKDGKKTGKFIKSPYANPFMDYDMMPLFKINGGWNELGERCIARYYCTYVTVIQVRNWLPDDIGGLVWFGYDNPAMTAYAPIYIGIEKVPESYKICGRSGFNLKCAWWAFNRVADFSAQKWGSMRHDVAKVWKKFENEIFSSQMKIEKEALRLYKKSPRKARRYLTRYSNEWMIRLEKAYWKLGDDLWSKYTGKF